MKVLLTGLGAQGKAALYDLIKNQDIKRIIVAESDAKNAEAFVNKLADERISLVEVDASNKEEMTKLFNKVDIIIDLLPTPFRKSMTQIAIETGKNIVNTSFRSNILEFNDEAKSKNIIVMPEAGLDPGIDLVLAGNAVEKFDEVETVVSSAGGIPVPEAANNPIKYKVSWSFVGVLSAYRRPANIIEKGKIIRIPGEEIFDYGEEVEIENVGKMERYPNGFSSTYAKQLELFGSVKNVVRYTLRWPGHVEFWKKMGELGLLEGEEIDGISPRETIAKIMEPNLQYKDDEKDMIIIRNEITGLKNGKRKRIVQSVIDYRDLETGLFAMNRTVGFTASIITQMIINGKISKKGILNPCKDVPYEEFIRELKKRNIIVTEKEEILEVI